MIVFISLIENTHAKYIALIARMTTDGISCLNCEENSVTENSAKKAGFNEMPINSSPRVGGPKYHREVL